MSAPVPSLKSFLNGNGSFESPEEGFHRKHVLEQIESIFHNWIGSHHPEKPKDCNRVHTGGLLTLGSYALGIHGPGADIDILLIVPPPLSRHDCFSGFYQLLRASYANQISWQRKIENTYVPVVKLTFLGIDVDMAFACFDVNVIPEPLQLLDDLWLKGLDIHSVRSLNGFRDCFNVKQLILPHFEKFQLTLRAIKLWASRRAVYNNSIGYFSGMALTVLLVKVMMEKAHDTSISSCFLILQAFFEKYANWTWPTAVKLNHLEANNVNAPVLQVWNPYEHSLDKSDRMPIITPSYPQRNSAYTATISTRRVIVQEFKRANNILNRNMMGKNCDWKQLWTELFVPQEFFRRNDFSCYLVLSATSEVDSVEPLSHWDWCAIVRSQIRRLLAEMEFLDPIRTLHVCPNSYPHPEARANTDFHSLWFIGITYHEKCAVEKNLLDVQLRTFYTNVIHYAQDHGVQLTGRSVKGKTISAEDIVTFLHPGILHGVKGWTALRELKKGHFYV